MFGFEINSDLLIVAIFAQTIAISLIILIIYFRTNKIHYKNIDLNEKIEEKIDRIESKLSYLSKQVLVISANEDKFKYQTAPFDASANYQTRVGAHGSTVSQSLLKDTTFIGHNIMDSKVVDTRLSVNANANENATEAEESETNSIPVIERPLFSKPNSESAATSTTSSSSSLSPQNNSFSEISKSNKPGDVAAKDLSTDFVQNNDGYASTNRFDHNDHIEKNTNPEIDKIEKEILTALKRLGGNDDDFGGLDGYDGGGSSREVVYPAAKKSDRQVKNSD